MAKKLGWIALLVLGLSLGVVWQIGSANCNDIGGAGSQTIICDASAPNPFTPGDTRLEGAGGNDSIEIQGNSTLNGTIRGDGDGAGGFLVGLGGNDTITNYSGTVTGDIFGDHADGDGGADLITNYSGTVTGDILGDNVAGNGGNDTIINSGTVSGDISGDAVNGNGGNDTIINSGTVSGGIFGDTAAGMGGNDLIIIHVGSTVGGNIDGEGGNDTIEFRDVDAAAQAIINACLTPASCDIVIGTKTYRLRSFETLHMVLLAVAAAQSEEFSGELVVVTREFCRGAVKAFRLPNGDVEVYSGFDLLPPNGFLVGVIPNGQTGTFSSNNKSWKLTIGADGRIRVFDIAQNLVGDQCVR